MSSIRLLPGSGLAVLALVPVYWRVPPLRFRLPKPAVVGAPKGPLMPRLVMVAMESTAPLTICVLPV